MIALLDVNVLVALFDPVHCHHERAHEWLANHRDQGWASCPLTENGFVRVLSSSGYPGRRTTVEDAIHRLEVFRRSGEHTFWPDMVSLRDGSLFEPRKIGGPRQITDVYLLALAVKNGGRLATFDRSISAASVHGATAASLSLL